MKSDYHKPLIRKASSSWVSKLNGLTWGTVSKKFPASNSTAVDLAEVHISTHFSVI